MTRKKVKKENGGQIITHSLVIIKSAHLIRMMFGILSDPGALNGFRCAMC